MTLVSSTEFAANQQKYFDIAERENVCIKRGNGMFHLVYANVDEANRRERVYYEPDEDFYRSISMDELRRRIKEDIHQWYKERNESNSIARGTAIS